MATTHKVSLSESQLRLLIDGLAQQIMDTKARLDELKSQHQELSQKLSGESGSNPAPAPKAKRNLSDEARAKIADAQRKRWAKGKDSGASAQTEAA